MINSVSNRNLKYGNKIVPDDAYALYVFYEPNCYIATLNGEEKTKIIMKMLSKDMHK